LSLNLNEEKDGASLMSFGTALEFQMRGPADRKPREAGVVLHETGFSKKVDGRRSK